MWQSRLRLDLPSLRSRDKVLNPCVYPTRQRIALVLALIARNVGDHGESETYQGPGKVKLGQHFSKYHLKTVFRSKGTEAFWR